MALILCRNTERAYNTETGALHVVRVAGVGDTQVVTDLGPVTQAEEAAGGVPLAEGLDAAGADTFTTIFTCPAVVCHRILVQLEPGYDAVLSLDGGTTDTLTMKANTQLLLDGLNLPAGSVLQAKNKTAGENYTNLRMLAW